MYVIAEIGTNHNGNYDTAHKLLVEACKCGVQAVKMNYWDIDLLAAKTSKWYKRGAKLQLSIDNLDALAYIAKDFNVDFIIAPFTEDHADEIVDIADGIKIASSEITNHKLLKAYADSPHTMYMSTGMATFEEISRAVEIAEPDVLMHCVSLYPTPTSRANLGRLDSLKAAFPNKQIGYSDHTTNSIGCKTAYARGYKIIEKHFNIQYNYCVDSNVSILPEAMKDMLYYFRMVESLLSNEYAFTDIVNIPKLRRGPSGLRE